MLSVAMENAERWEDASLSVGEAVGTRDLRWPEELMHSSVNMDISKWEELSVVQTRKENKGLA